MRIERREPEIADAECYPRARRGLNRTQWMSCSTDREAGDAATAHAAAESLERQIVQPPDTSMTAPLMYDASSDASHA